MSEPGANLPRVFALVGIVFGVIFVVANAGGLPGAWHPLALVAGALAAVAAVWSGLVRTPPATAAGWSGSATAYWRAVAAEVVAIPVGALVLSRPLDRPELVVLWVVFVVGAHFLPARAFGVGRYTELGLLLIAIAVLGVVLRLAADVDSAPAAGGVLAGLSLLTFAAIPALSRSRGPRL